jgi:predicted metal-dependent phosphoesterase TrpH
MRIDFHVHSTHSGDGQNTIGELALEAKKRNLDAIAICDHNVLTPRTKTNVKGLLILFGEEVSCAEGHACIFGVKRAYPRGIRVRELVRKVHAEGGIVVIPHPFSRWRDGMGELAFKAGADAVEKYNGADPLNNMLAMGRKYNGTAGSDAHSVHELGNAYTEMDCAPSERAILEAVRKGRYKPFWKLNPVGYVRRQAGKVGKLLTGQRKRV